MDFEVPLNRLIFGQEDGAGINARVTGRQDGIAELAANLHANGQIENLVVKKHGPDNGAPVPEGYSGPLDVFAVSNGNRRLAAFHMIYSQDSTHLVRVTSHDVDENTAFEQSLATAITARQLHPVDQYEAFARMEERGKTNEEIQQQYGMTGREVRQVLALGRLSPKIRQAWRDGILKAEAARAFTLALDHRTQDKAFDKLSKDGRIYESFIKKELGAETTDAEVARLIDFVGADAYRAAGGSVTEDLFGSSHIISSAPLLKQMAVQLLEAECARLKADGWAWADLEANLPQGSRFWAKSELKEKDLVFEGDEKARLEKLEADLKTLNDADSYDQDEEERLQAAIDAIEVAVRMRSFDARKKAKLGCIVDVEDGRLVVISGVKKPEEVRAAPVARDDDDAPAGGKKATAAKATPEEPEISGALLHRLSLQLTKGAATALIQDEQLALSVLLAGFGCHQGDSGVKVHVSGLGSRGNDRDVLGSTDMEAALPLAARLKPAERISLLAQIAANALDFQGSSLDLSDKYDSAAAICNAIDAKALNAALRGAFDAEGYFAGVNKALCLKAIDEACGPDLARQQSKNGKGDIADFAVENVPKTGWLPPQLRARGYDGPPKAKVLAVVPKAAAKGNAGKPSPASKKAKAKIPVKRAAATKKAARKTTAKKRKAA